MYTYAHMRTYQTITYTHMPGGAARRRRLRSVGPHEPTSAGNDDHVFERIRDGHSLDLSNPTPGHPNDPAVLFSSQRSNMFAFLAQTTSVEARGVKARAYDDRA